MSGRLGVLLMTYGSPAADLHDLPEYLAAVRGGREPSPELVDEFRRRYELIGGSPLTPITRAQAAAVSEQLRADGHDAAATVGMRFSAPTVLDGLRELAELGCETVSAIVMSPQYSDLLMAGYARAVEAAVAELGPNAPGVQLAPAWYREPGFIEAVAERVRDGLASLPDGAAVLLTAHSLPRRVADAEPGYLDQLCETAEAVATAARLPDDPATVRFDEGAQARLAIATRYLGPEAGRAYADPGRRPPGWIVRLPAEAARAWDLADKLPPGSSGAGRT